MKVELTRFKVKEGKAQRVDEWMKLLNESMPAILLTLEDEKMYVEAIFRESNEEGEFLYWLSIQGEGAINIKDSVHEIDKRHVEFSHECLDTNYKALDMKLEVTMLPEWIKGAIIAHEREKNIDS